MTDDRPWSPLTGGCKCGKVRLRMEAAPIITHCCHCRDCQKSSGSAFRINAMIETEYLNVTHGQTEPFQTDDLQHEVRCAACGFTLWGYHPRFGEAIAFVGVGLLDEGERLQPEAHYFTRSKHPWITLPPDVPAFEQLGDAGKAGVRARIDAAMAGRSSAPT
jgi:hypothetical protein